MFSKLDDQIQKPFQAVADKLWAWRDISQYLLASNMAMLTCLALGVLTGLAGLKGVDERDFIFLFLVPLNAWSAYQWFTYAKQFHGMNGKDLSRLSIEDGILILVFYKMRMVNTMMIVFLGVLVALGPGIYSYICLFVTITSMAAGRFATCLPRPPAKRSQREKKASWFLADTASDIAP